MQRVQHPASPVAVQELEAIGSVRGDGILCKLCAIHQSIAVHFFVGPCRAHVPGSVVPSRAWSRQRVRAE